MVEYNFKSKTVVVLWYSCSYLLMLTYNINFTVPSAFQFHSIEVQKCMLVSFSDLFYSHNLNMVELIPIGEKSCSCDDCSFNCFATIQSKITLILYMFENFILLEYMEYSEDFLEILHTKIEQHIHP